MNLLGQETVLKFWIHREGVFQNLHGAEFKRLMTFKQKVSHHVECVQQHFLVDHTTPPHLPQRADRK